MTKVTKNSKEPRSPKCKRNYSNEDLLAAINTYKASPLRKSKRELAKDYGIPEATLRFQITKVLKKGGDFHVAHAFGKTRRRLLTDAEENVIFKHIVDCSERGPPVMKGMILHIFNDVEKHMRVERELRETREELIARLDRCNLFEEGKLREGWFRAFKNRFKDRGLKMKKPEPISAKRLEVTEKDVTQWFYDRTEYFKEKNLSDVIADPKRMYNIDETFVKFTDNKGFVLTCEKPGKKKNIVLDRIVE